MSADGVEAFGQTRHRVHDLFFRRTQVHDDAGIGRERGQLFEQSQNRGHGRGQDYEINFREEFGGVAISVVHDVLGQSQFEGGKMRVNPIESSALASQSQCERAAHQSQSDDGDFGLCEIKVRLVHVEEPECDQLLPPPP